MFGIEKNVTSQLKSSVCVWGFMFSLPCIFFFFWRFSVAFSFILGQICQSSPCLVLPSRGSHYPSRIMGRLCFVLGLLCCSVDSDSMLEAVSFPCTSGLFQATLEYSPVYFLCLCSVFVPSCFLSYQEIFIGYNVVWWVLVV